MEESNTGENPNNETESSNTPTGVPTPSGTQTEEQGKTAQEKVQDKLGNESKQEEQKEDAIVPKESLPFDIATLSIEQVQQLKRLLEVTPEQPTIDKPKQPKIRLRFIDDKVVESFGKSFKGLTKNPDTGLEVITRFIKIKFVGEKEEKQMIFSEFIQSPQIFCDVISVKEEPKEKIVGETVSRETGRLVNMVNKWVEIVYTIKLPNGDSLDIEKTFVNG